METPAKGFTNNRRNFPAKIETQLNIGKFIINVITRREGLQTWVVVIQDVFLDSKTETYDTFMAAWAAHNRAVTELIFLDDTSEEGINQLFREFRF